MAEDRWPPGPFASQPEPKKGHAHRVSSCGHLATPDRATPWPSTRAIPRSRRNLRRSCARRNRALQARGPPELLQGLVRGVGASNPNIPEGCRGFAKPAPRTKAPPFYFYVCGRPWFSPKTTARGKQACAAARGNQVVLVVSKWVVSFWRQKVPRLEWVLKRRHAAGKPHFLRGGGGGGPLVSLVNRNELWLLWSTHGLPPNAPSVGRVLFRKRKETVFQGKPVIRAELFFWGGSGNPLHLEPYPYIGGSTIA